MFIFNYIKWNVFANEVDHGPGLFEHLKVLGGYGEPSLKEALKMQQQSLPYMLLIHLHKQKKYKLLMDVLNERRQTQGSVRNKQAYNGRIFLFIYK